MLPEERRKAKALMEDIATKEHELKVRCPLGAIVFPYSCATVKQSFCYLKPLVSGEYDNNYTHLLNPEECENKETRSQALNSLFVRLEAEIDQMYAEAPAARDSGAIDAEEMRKTLGRVEVCSLMLFEDRSVCQCSAVLDAEGAKLCFPSKPMKIEKID